MRARHARSRIPVQAGLSELCADGLGSGADPHEVATAARRRGRHFRNWERRQLLGASFDAVVKAGAPRTGRGFMEGRDVW